MCCSCAIKVKSGAAVGKTFCFTVGHASYNIHDAMPLTICLSLVQHCEQQGPLFIYKLASFKTAMLFNERKTFRQYKLF